MKRVILFISLLVSIEAVAQDKPSYFIGLPGQTSHARGNLRVDSTFLNALRDTTFTPWRLGLQVFRPADSSLYVSTSLVAASKWTKLAANTGGPVWGTITGTLSSQTDLWNVLQGKQDTITTGTTSQYIDGTLGLRNFSSEVTSITDPLYSPLAHSHSGLAPIGGSTGQILTKNSGTNYDYSWQNPSAGSGTVTNVATGLWLGGGPITSTGTIQADSAAMAAYFIRLKDSGYTYTTPTWVTNAIAAIGTPTLQQVLTSGSTLTTNHTINHPGFDLIASGGAGHGLRGNATTGYGLYGSATGSGGVGVLANASGSNSYALSAGNSATSGTNYAVQALAEGSGATTNIGGSFEAYNATNNYALIVPSGAGRVGIGTGSPDSKAILDVSSTTQGVLFPRLTTTQQNAITSPSTGLIIFNTDTAGLCEYNGSAWLKLRGSGTGGGSSLRFGVSGEDATATQDRFFNADDFIFAVDSVKAWRYTTKKTGLRYSSFGAAYNGSDWYSLYDSKELAGIGIENSSNGSNVMIEAQGAHDSSLHRINVLPDSIVFSGDDFRFKNLPNKSVAGTDSVMVADVNGKLFKVQQSAIGGGTLDATPTDGSTNGVESNGVFDALALKANIASPIFTGNPTAPTPATGNNTTSIATTEFVHNTLASTVSIQQGHPDGATITLDYEVSDIDTVNISGNRTIVIDNLPGGDTIATGVLFVIHTVASTTLTLPGYLATGDAFSGNAGDLDMLTWISRGGRLFWQITPYGTVGSQGSGGGGGGSYPASLLAYWDFEETSGDFQDNTTNNKDLVRQGSATTTTGKINSGVGLNGTSQYLTGPGTGLSGSTAFTIEGWFKVTSNANPYQVLVQKGTVAGSNFEYNIYWDNASDNLFFQISGNGTSIVSVTKSFTPDGNYHYIAARYDGAFIVLSIDDGVIAYTAATSLYSGSGALHIGADPTPGNYQDGGVDILRIWNTYRSDAEITASYNSGAGLEM